MNPPIITSLLDTDFYKFTMGNFAFKCYPDVKVKYAFKNRTTSVKLANFIDTDELLYQLDCVASLRFTMDELNYLEKMEFFSRDYLRFLNTLKMPPIYVDEEDGQLNIETEGNWSEAIFWETFVLSIVNEMYYKHKSHYVPGYLGIYKDRLNKKIEIINQNPFSFLEFGTRRRYSKQIQDDVIWNLQGRVSSSCFKGTSNVYFAKKYGLIPKGTMGHEAFMVLAGINDYNNDMLAISHDRMLYLWQCLYGKDLSIALTDTFGTDFFFKDFTKEKAEFWNGLRQDSGDPIEFGYKAIKFYKDKNIDPKKKVVIFSDGLNIDKILELEKEFKDKLITGYGWGTNLTNDLGFDPLSIVMKAVGANKRPLVKLSDNLAKSVGDKKTVENYKNLFVYNNTYTEPTLY